MFGTSFLTSFESQLVARDYNQMLKSAAACSVAVTQRSRTGSTTDTTYGVQVGGNLIVSTVSVKAIQQIVNPFRRVSLNWGKPFEGDCIFYFPATETAIPAEGVIEYRITDPSGSVWNSIPDTPTELLEFLRVRLGPVSKQIGVIVVAKLESK